MYAEAAVKTLNAFVHSVEDAWWEDVRGLEGYSERVTSQVDKTCQSVAVGFEDGSYCWWNNGKGQWEVGICE